MTTMTRTFANVTCRKMKPTQHHRPAMWENMLGTVYAFNGVEVAYFDYDWDAAAEFAGITPDRDPRVWKGIAPGSYSRVQPIVYITR